MKQIAADPERVWHSNKSVAENLEHGAVRKSKVTSIDLAKIAGARKAALPAFISPQLATLTKNAPTDDRWVHEIKYDGYRMLCRIDAGVVQIYSRNRKEWTAQFPRIARALADLPLENAWIDGEIVILDAQGRRSFQALAECAFNEHR